MTIFSKFLTIAKYCAYREPVRFGSFVALDLLNKLFPMIVFLVLLRGIGEIASPDLAGAGIKSSKVRIILLAISVLILLQPAVKIACEISYKNLIAVLLEQYLKDIINRRYAALSTSYRLRPAEIGSNLITDSEKLFDAVANIAPTAVLITLCIIALTLFLSPFFAVSIFGIILLSLGIRKLSARNRKSQVFRRIDVLRKKRWLNRLNKKIGKKTSKTFARADKVEGYYFNPKMKSLWRAGILMNNIPFAIGAVALLLLILQFSMLIQTAQRDEFINILSFVIVIRFFVNFLRQGYIQFIRFTDELDRNATEISDFAYGR